MLAGLSPLMSDSHRSVSCHSCYTLTEKDFRHNGRIDKTFVIDRPGKYCLGETIHWDPKCHDKAAIIIDACNVLLDLCGHELKQINCEHRAVGIHVKTGHDTVSIINGAVRHFTQLGIVVDGGNSNIFLGNDDSYLKVTNCGHGSKFAFLDCETEEPILQGGILLGQTKAFEERGYYTYQGRINTARIVNVYAEKNAPTGMYVGVGSDILVQNSLFCRNAETRKAHYSNPIAIGNAFVDEHTTIAMGVLCIANRDFGDEDSVTIDFTNCHFDENSATGDTPVVFGFDAGYNIDGLTLRKCTFNANQGTGATTSNGFGIYPCIIGGNKGVLVEDCEAVDNFSNYFTSGFHHSGRNLSFNPEKMTPGEGLVYRRCKSLRNTASGSLDFVGVSAFEFYFSLGLTVEDCESLNNKATSLNPAAYASVQGMIFGGRASLNGPIKNVSISDCHVAGNTVKGDGDVEGIIVFGASNNVVIKDSVIQNNSGAGFDVGIWTLFQDDDLSRIVVQNCTIEDENIGIYSNGDANSLFEFNTITDADIGIFLDGSSCDFVNDNNITNVNFGIIDSGIPSTSTFQNNRVFNATTASILPAGAIVINNVFTTGNPVCRNTDTAVTHTKLKAAIAKRVVKASKLRASALRKIDPAPQNIKKKKSKKTTKKVDVAKQ